ncbi:MAG: GNAT family N-acetyltransferase [Oscillospiraceae bacterium]|nr:GNAT family N-acetyltransferase [Oscillospiraceae bacterium]
MLDKTIPHIGVIMTKAASDYPRFALPAGFCFCGYQTGMEEAWARLMVHVEQIDSLEEARNYFRKEFLARPELLAKQCLFVLDETGEIAATASIWPGNHFGQELLRVHWVACAPQHQGKGLAKALLDTLSAMKYDQLLYLTSQTWSYQALGLYARFGFVPYHGEKPMNWKAGDAGFAQETKIAWNMIEEKWRQHSNSTTG